ncbi:TonB C-terminal domain-containing protein [Arcobacter ellisii]|uniref:TonB C-terminal domain-containing protein n=1 Tax=Arcobacter ellisii TaxID=913109 RepID=A0A347U8D4_9BACT|nr:TonB C-terminal domain-containing protein [Arcobacter ellisii]AXX95112.1 hypothetical protein AELL_1450 [Arcobacter ellisii]RXI29001.1 hypothetical protein CP962_12330 [Arcobacter ellisii]
MIKKILVSFLMLFSLISANDDFIDSYYSSIGERLSEWIPVGENEKATLNIFIDENGAFDYEFIKKANSEEFNNSLKNFLEKQKKIKYPVYKNKKIKIKTDFESEKK